MVKRMSIFVSALIATMFIAGCGDVYHKHLVGPYSLSAIDVEQQMAVYYDFPDGGGIGRIEPVVFSVGWDKRYIVAKQHPSGNRSVTDFYYLDMTKDSKYAEPTNSVVGPLTEAEFLRKQRELSLPGFTLTIKSIE